MQPRFPGIDPYVEASGRWPDFHSRFMNDWCDAISARLPEDYFAGLEEQLTIVEYEEARGQRRAPDIVVSQSYAGRTSNAAEGIATLEPDLEPRAGRIVIEEEVRQSYIQIQHLPDRRLVAVLELLSPANKEGDGRTQYLAKRQQVLLSEAHLVDLDLLIGGRGLPMEQPLENHFHAIVARAGQRPDCAFYSWNLDRPLPAIPIPLSEPDPDVIISLA